jgi:hypothetical protein
MNPQQSGVANSGVGRLRQAAEGTPAAAETGGSCSSSTVCGDSSVIGRDTAFESAAAAVAVAADRAAVALQRSSQRMLVRELGRRRGGGQSAIPVVSYARQRTSRNDTPENKGRRRKRKGRAGERSERLRLSGAGRKTPMLPRSRSRLPYISRHCPSCLSHSILDLIR